MPRYIYKPILQVVEDTYMENAKQDIYEALGPVDFSMCRISVYADSEEEATAIRKGVTDIRMWTLEEVKD